MPDTIESKLAAALGGVEAPDELWSRVQAELPTTVRRRSAGRIWPRFLMAAAMAALMSGGVVYLKAQASRHSTGAGSSSSLAAVAIRAHETGTSWQEANYSVDRRRVSGQAVTLVSEPSAASPEARKQVRTTESGLLAVSEWIVGGRRWAMVTPKRVHQQACAICHRA